MILCAWQLAPGQAVMRTITLGARSHPCSLRLWPWTWVFQQQHVKIFSLLLKGMFGKRDRKAYIPPTPQPSPPHIPWSPASSRAGGRFGGSYLSVFHSNQMRSKCCSTISQRLRNRRVSVKHWLRRGWKSLSSLIFPLPLHLLFKQEDLPKSVFPSSRAQHNRVQPWFCHLNPTTKRTFLWE